MQYFTKREIEQMKATAQKMSYPSYDDYSRFLDNEMDYYVSNGINYNSNNKYYNKLLEVSSILNDEIFEASKEINNNMYDKNEVQKITDTIYKEYGLDSVNCVYYILSKCSKHEQQHIKKYIDLVKMNYNK